MFCERSACKASINKMWLHRQNKTYYCSKCARLINETNPGLVIRTIYSQTQLLQLGRIVLEEAGLSDIDEIRIEFFIKDIQRSSAFKDGVKRSADVARNLEQPGEIYW